MKVRDLMAVKNRDMTIPRNTYLTPVKAFNSFIKGEMLWVNRFDSTNTIVFRPMDGKEYSITEDKLKNFALTGR